MSGKVCILTTVHPPFDTRIFHKEAKSLAKAGYDVTLIAQHDKDEVVEGIKIVQLSKPKNRLERITRTVWLVYRKAIKLDADIYHFHDPELMIVGIILRFFGKKVIYDVHEDVPKQVLNKDWLGNMYVRKFAAFIINIVEKVGALLFSKIVVATTDIARKFSKKKVVILRNFPVLELTDNIKSVNCNKNKSVIIYAGGLSRIRGIKDIVRAMKYVGDRAELWLLGKWESEKFKKECEDLEEWKYVKYLGFVTLDKVYKYMKISNIGISMLHPVKNYLTSLPVKAFEYMACSLPIIMSNFPYFQKNFKECALFVTPFDFKDIAKKVLYFLDNPDKAKKNGKRGRKLIEEKYSWEAESKKLLEMYEGLLK